MFGEGNSTCAWYTARSSRDAPPALPRKNDLVIERYISSPAVSHICNFTSFSDVTPVEGSRDATATTCDVKAAPGPSRRKVRERQGGQRSRLHPRIHSAHTSRTQTSQNSTITTLDTIAVPRGRWAWSGDPTMLHADVA